MAKKKKAPKSAKPTRKLKPTKALKKKAPKQQLVETAEILSSVIVYDGPLFKRAPRQAHRARRQAERTRRHPPQWKRRHPGPRSSKSKKDPWIVIERQYRHAANQFLWELPAGKLEAGEEPSPARSANSKKKPATKPKNGAPWSSTTPAPAFSANP